MAEDARNRLTPPHVRAVFFDAGFTLVEPVDPIERTYFSAAAAEGVALNAADFTRVLNEQRPKLNRDYRCKHPNFLSSEEMERQAWRDFTLSIAAAFPSLAAIHEAWHRRLATHFDSAPAWRPTPGAAAVLRQMKDRGLIVGVVSNWHSALHDVLAGHELTPHCDFVLTSAEVGRKKPHGEIFQRALAAAGVQPHEAVHVGDSWHDDVQGALAAGISPILFSRSPTAWDNEPVPRIACLTELLGVSTTRTLRSDRA